MSTPVDVLGLGSSVRARRDNPRIVGKPERVSQVQMGVGYSEAEDRGSQSVSGGGMIWRLAGVATNSTSGESEGPACM